MQEVQRLARDNFDPIGLCSGLELSFNSKKFAVSSHIPIIC
jgi:hypothetical protein